MSTTLEGMNTRGSVVAEVAEAMMNEQARKFNPALDIPPNKKYRAIITNEAGTQKIEEFDSRSFSTAFYHASDFLKEWVRNDYSAKWRMTCVEEIGTR
jgi:hypothetical protein